MWFINFNYSIFIYLCISSRKKRANKPNIWDLTISSSGKSTALLGTSMLNCADEVNGVTVNSSYTSVTEYRIWPSYLKGAALWSLCMSLNKIILQQKMQKCKTFPLKLNPAVSQSPGYHWNINTKSKLHPCLRQIIGLILYITLSSLGLYCCWLW